ncbi:nuclear transport factor 2 family protein [Lacihabitans sp. CCS-44]|uniref:nuclear transport factor 2 family protein n=1 Tax=Lacihabitans sp. CCS-44 TaxID=2487331 RepID=UPI0020CEB2A9|nr:nuclear transport factor 2 family protein [Lacihabitans sp. CCS-44]MCP9757186.1 nuclear transport factor 2 family protein [Lacihabitans sp. CCS-44]
MKKSILGIITIILFSMNTFAQNTAEEIKTLSKNKWQWMADKDVDKLAKLFDNQSMFVHMGGSWGKERELEIIKSGFIHYKKADVHEVFTPIIIENTVILLNRITLTAVVGTNEVVNPFMVTEVYVKVGNEWKMGSLSFSKLMGPN